MEGSRTEKRQRSPRRYPYYTLKAAINVAERVYLQGGGRVSRTQAAELLDVKSTSSVLEMRLITASQFGLVKRTEGYVQITPLGQKVIRPASEAERAQALIDAFSSVPLFKELLNRYRGMPLPNDEGLRNVLIRDFGIPERYKNEALNTLINSAKEAGILVRKPSGTWFSSLPGGLPESNGDQEAGDRGVSAEESAKHEYSPSAPKVLGLHPSVEGLIRDLPGPGSDWAPDDRDAWEAALRAIFDVVYPASRRRKQVSPTG